MEIPGNVMTSPAVSREPMEAVSLIASAPAVVSLFCARMTPRALWLHTP
jgi:hypothetical protein